MTNVQEVRSPIRTGMSRAQLVGRYETDRLGFLLEAVGEYGPVVELVPQTVLIADPAAAHVVLSGTNTNFLLSQDFMRDQVESRRGEAALEERMTGRRAAMAAMTPRALEAHGQWLQGETTTLSDRWLRQGTVTDALGDLQDLMARSFTRFCFGDRAADEVTAGAEHLLECLFPIQSSPVRPPRILRSTLPRYRRARSAHRQLAEQLERTIAAPGEGGLADDMRRKGMPSSSIVRMLVSLFIASRNVPAAALAWALLELADNEELADRVAHDDGTLRQVIDETVRLWPPTWMIFRTTATDQVCGEWRIPAGSAVMVSPYVLHRTADCFTRPQEFLPSRWRDVEPPHGAYIPFGGGTRWCVGAHFAIAEISAVIKAVTGRMRLRTESPRPLPAVRTTLTPSTLPLQVTART